LLIGEEYFGTVYCSMFTIFRCLVADCTTQDGRSLIVPLSDAYGYSFDLPYCFGMVLMIFGLFNIITALFVDAMLTGLKNNETQRKVFRMYQAAHVKNKLKDVVERMHEMGYGRRDLDTLRLSPHTISVVLADPVVKDLLKDIDIFVDETSNWRALFAYGQDGMISVPHFIEALTSVRGDVHKFDLAQIGWALRALQAKTDQIDKVMSANHRTLVRHMNPSSIELVTYASHKDSDSHDPPTATI